MGQPPLPPPPPPGPPGARVSPLAVPRHPRCPPRWAARRQPPPAGLSRRCRQCRQSRQSRQLPAAAAAPAGDRRSGGVWMRQSIAAPFSPPARPGHPLAAQRQLGGSSSYFSFKFIYFSPFLPSLDTGRTAERAVGAGAGEGGVGMPTRALRGSHGGRGVRDRGGGE